MPTTRRGFLGAAAGAAAAALAPFPAAAAAQTSPAAPSPVPAASPTPLPANPGVEALARLARERYGKFLTAEELIMLDERVTAIERRGARLRAVKLVNSEEPATSFRVRR